MTYTNVAKKYQLEFFYSNSKKHNISERGGVSYTTVVILHASSAFVSNFYSLSICEHPSYKFLFTN